MLLPGSSLFFFCCVEFYSVSSTLYLFLLLFVDIGLFPDIHLQSVGEQELDSLGPNLPFSNEEIEAWRLRVTPGYLQSHR